MKEVQPLSNYTILVSFMDGKSKKYNVAPLFDKWDVFRDLYRIQGLFDRVKVDCGGFGVSWNDDIDLSANELWVNGASCIR